MRHSATRAQSLLEYTMLAVVIIAGIIVGGPYLLNSVSGYFKLADDSVEDSFSENIRQSQDPNPPGPACACSSWRQGTCGAGICTGTQRIHHRTCSPMGCDKEQDCGVDANCCNPIHAVDCGVLLNGAGGSDNECHGRAPLNSHFNSGFTGTCLDVSGTDLNKCTIGERRYAVTCGYPSDDPNAPASKTFYACKEDAESRAACLPVCWGNPSANTTPCSLAETPQSLIREVAIRKQKTDTPPRILELFSAADAPERINAFKIIYAHTAACNPNRACERACASGSVPTPDGLACCEALCGNQCACAEGQYCAEDHCESCSGGAISMNIYQLRAGPIAKLNAEYNTTKPSSARADEETARAICQKAGYGPATGYTYQNLCAKGYFWWHDANGWGWGKGKPFVIQELNCSPCDGPDVPLIITSNLHGC